jgi:hypothetical protein
MNHLMRLTAATALIACGTASASPPPLFTPVGIYTGGMPAFSEQHVVPDGRKSMATVLQISAALHQMDLLPGSVQPIGLATLFSIAKENNDGQAARCMRWVERVANGEAAWMAAPVTAKPMTFPYLAMTVAAGATPAYTINGGMPVYREADVLCWEAEDFGPPVY